MVWPEDSTDSTLLVEVVNPLSNQSFTGFSVKEVPLCGIRRHEGTHLTVAVYAECANQYKRIEA